ncbi:deleted in lung and esophageal cancer protein 1 isoform X4 [Leopardus geoffroyi]|uniref:deleted in lung and esophageal cancer protein 1 isoform X4 n=1 Tax=Leopardus geoffroyi TaxID=46844 RepID=UPI001E261DAC|nr:deleted in lung and esophageal cancer protein 1 isoform X4 [Leopardus geoffroyi]
METGRAGERLSAESGSCAFGGATWTPASRQARVRSPSESTRLSSVACSEASHYGFGGRARRAGPAALRPLPEPPLLRLRPTSLRTQDISHLLTGLFRSLYTNEVIGEDLSANLIKARGSQDARHEEFVDELRRIRELYKQRLDEIEMLERHIIQGRARALAEKERIMQQADVHAQETFIKIPPVKSIFRWCVDSVLLQKHHLICPDDYYRDTVPFCSAPKGVSVPGCSKLTFSCEKRSVPKKHLTKKLEDPCRKMLTKSDEELDYTVDSLTWDSSLEAKHKTVQKTSPPKNKNWMNHLPVPQRELERLLLARMDSRIRFLKNPRFFPPNTPRGGTSLLFPPKKPVLTGDLQSGEPVESCADTPVFLAKPSIGFFTDYEVGPVYEMAISLQNTTAASRCLRVIPPSTPYFALGLGMFPGKGGMVAPGMTCQYIVQFSPDCLGDFDDFILVETQSAHTLVIPLQARRPPPVLTLSPVLDCGYCLIGGMKITRFLCKNVGFSVGKFCIMPKKSWPPLSFRAVATLGFVEQPPFGILPSMFELAPGQALYVEVSFLPTSLEKAEQTFIIVCDNCQIKELVTVGIGQVVALDLIYISGEESQPEPGELTDVTAQHFIRFEPENVQSTARKQLIIRNATHVELAFHWQIMKPNLQPLMPGETYSMDSLKYHPDRETAFSVLPERGVLSPHTDHEFILSFSPRELRDFHSVLQMVLEEVPEPTSLELETLKDCSCSADDVIVLEIEVKGSVEPFQVLLEPYALIIPGENYIGINVKKDFKVSPFDIEPSSGQIPALGECRVTITLEAKQCQRLQTVLELEVVNGAWSYLPVYANVQEPYVYLQNSHVEVSNLYLGVPTKATVRLINGTLLPTRFHWGKLLGHQADFCTAKVSPRRGTLGPSEERQLSLEFTAHTQDELSHLALPCTVSGMKEPVVLGISGKPQGLQVAIAISAEGSDGSVPSTELWPDRLQERRLDFGSAVPLRTGVNRQLILTNHSPIQTPFTLKFEYFGGPPNGPSQKPSLPDAPPALLKTSRVRERSAKREQLNFMESLLSHGKGAAFFPHISQGTLGAHQQLRIDITGYANMWGEYWDDLICTVGDLPPTVIPVHMAVVGCPISSLRTTYSTTDQLQKEPVIRFGTQVSGGDTVTRVLRLNNSSPCDIRLDWETYTPEDREDRLVELLVFYGPPFPLRDQAGNDLLCPETPASSSSFWSPSCSAESDSSREAAQSAEGRSRVSDRASRKIVSVVLREHDGVPCGHLYRVSPKQMVVPAGGSSSISVSFTPVLLGPGTRHKVECVGYALGFMSLDDEVARELPGRRRRLQDFAVGALRLDLCSSVRPAQLSVEPDYGGGTEFWHQASDLIPKQPCSGVLSELVTTHRLKLTNTTEIPQSFRLLVSRPFSVAQDGASRSRRAPGRVQGCDEEPAMAGQPLVLRPKENMLVNVSFSLSLELLSYQKLPADQMLPGVDVRRRANGEKEMVFTQNLLLEYADQPAQVVPLKATVAVPELQLSTSWVDFGTCFVNQARVREVYLMNLSGCRSYWAVLMGRQEPDNDPGAFRVSPSSGLLEARLVNAPPNTTTLQVFFTARSSELYEATLAVEGVLGEAACTLRLRGQGSYDERYVSPHQL